MSEKSRRPKTRGFYFPVMGSLFTVPMPFSPTGGIAGGNVWSCSGGYNESQCVNSEDCVGGENLDACQNMGVCGKSVNWNDCGNVDGCQGGSNPDGCTNNVCMGSQNNGDGDWFLCEMCCNELGCYSGIGYGLTSPKIQ